MSGPLTSPGTLLLRLRVAGLLLFAVGVQAHEAVGTVGLALTAATSLPELRALAWKPWRALGLWMAWTLVGTSLGGAFPNGTGVARTLDWLLVPLVALALPTVDARNLRRIVIAAGITLVVSCALAGLQHYGLWPDEASFAPLAWTGANFHRVYEPVPGAEGRFMGGGLVFNRLKFAHITALFVVAFFVLGLRSRGRDRVLSLVVAGVGLVSVALFPYARMAVVSLAGALAVAAMILAPNRKKAFLAGLLVIAIVGGISFAIPSVRARFLLSTSTGSNGDRAMLLATGVRAVEAHPVVGVGAGRFRPSTFALSTTPQHVLENPGKAHNQVLSIAAETGVAGALLFLLMLVSLVVAARRRPLGALTMSVLALFVLLGLAHDPLFQTPFSMALVLLVGAGLAPAFQRAGVAPTA